jgi:transcriptional regulator with XRE-family HTH domain
MPPISAIAELSDRGATGRALIIVRDMMDKIDQTDVAPREETTRPDRERDPARLSRTVGQIVRNLRRLSGLTLDQLATRAGVSRAMLSSVERGEKSPTLSVLAGIASGLDVSISRLMGEESVPEKATVIRRTQRLILQDPVTGIERHLLSPTHLASGVELVEHVLPPGAEFPGSPAHEHQTEKYLVVRSGNLTLEVETVSYVLYPEDSIYFHINSNYRFINQGDVPCRYYIFILHTDRVQPRTDLKSKQR